MDFTLTGQLVGLRVLRESDLDSLVAWWSDPRTMARQTHGPFVAKQAAEVAAMFRTWSTNDGADAGLAAVELATGELIGHVALFGATVKDRCATLGVMIGAPHQGRGLGTDAVRTIVDFGFTELGLHRIHLSVNGDNPAAIAAYRKVGFVEEGRLREAFFRGGRWHDDVKMGLLAREHQAALRVEVFAADLDAFVDFYTRVLGFDLADDRRKSENPYAAVASGLARIGAVPSWSAVDPAARSVPSGTEIVLEVGDVEAAYRRASDSGWPIADPLTERPWGLRDFRVSDPDGYYVRVTSR
ncbi:GNAT family N-acetyltransferase [Catenulispora sp. NF23]|uniref:GNAT family N-acetyltransferase n=1 Tax=Catenulispora pinistramenti TaxID=2705254 RepID=UPI001BAC2BE8|nr:GNAT family N-acetyltransferase [Catenulispora pinistramenti]MBS2539009.1 GNAT family N-acetyltransferase [Catenulispora pinistramenti]